MIIRSVDISGKSTEAQFDMVVLTVGQRPSEGTSDLTEMLGLELNPWGFGNTDPLFPDSNQPQRNLAGRIICGSQGHQ
jgi:heterodisulfide reductase subunit A